jgi:hypothetical protein
MPYARKKQNNSTRRLGLKALFAVALALTAVSLSSVAMADTQPVAGTAISTLGISVSGPVVLTNFAPGQTAAGSGTTTITSTGPWVLRLQDTSTTNPGHLLRTTGTTGTSALGQALAWQTTPTLGGTGGSGTLSGSAATAASGTFSDVVTLAYSQPIGSTEQLATGSVYGLTVTVTVSAS